MAESILCYLEASEVTRRLVAAMENGFGGDCQALAEALLVSGEEKERCRELVESWSAHQPPDRPKPLQCPLLVEYQRLCRLSIREMTATPRMTGWHRSR
eukprot:33816-Eustigmatos_ZCMA.PRE.1